LCPHDSTLAVPQGYNLQALFINASPYQIFFAAFSASHAVNSQGKREIPAIFSI
jgi:hypothetical protein